VSRVFAARDRYATRRQRWKLEPWEGHPPRTSLMDSGWMITRFRNRQVSLLTWNVRSSKLLEPAANQEAHCLACSYCFLIVQQEWPLRCIDEVVFGFRSLTNAMYTMSARLTGRSASQVAVCVQGRNVGITC
jgi:hypothetical protein